MFNFVFAEYQSYVNEPRLEAKQMPESMVKTSKQSCFPQNFIFTLGLGSGFSVPCLIWGAKLIIKPLDGAGVAKPFIQAFSQPLK